jgi:hypothetical protein
MFGGTPFGNGGGGMPGRGGSGRGAPLDTTKLYETLEIPKDATQKQSKWTAVVRNLWSYSRCVRSLLFPILVEQSKRPTIP